MRLRYIEQVSFSKSEKTNFLDFTKRNESLVRTFGKDDVVCFLSKTEDQIVFVHNFFWQEPKKEKHIAILASARLRIAGGKWNPLRLANYAEQVGIRLDGLKRFEEHYRRLT